MDGRAAAQRRRGRSVATALLDRSTSLPPLAASAREARAALRLALTEAARQEWMDLAELALSEVVTNATLHAHTPIDLRILVFDDLLRVEVRDYNENLPSPRHYDEAATTGRGLDLVAAVASDCGVESLGRDGKIIWFCIDGSDPGEVGRDRGVWDPVVGAGDDPAGRERTPVVLERMPATLWLAAREHHDALLRELVLYVAEHPDRSVDFAAADRARRAVSGTLERALRLADARGESRPPVPDGHPSPLPWVPSNLDLQVEVDPDAAGDFAVLQDVLDEAEGLAVERRLLVRPGLPEIVAVRDWACEQVIAQLGGVAPSPWPGTAQERFETEVRVPARGPAEADLAWVSQSTRRVVAADHANRIVAISRPLADLLGWEVDALVGRRVVTLIPPSLREAHVAGFSRHLTTGVAHVLGVPLELPVLCRDGREMQCAFLVETAPADAGTVLYLAWIDPLGDPPTH